MNGLTAIQEVFARAPKAADKKSDELGQKDFLRLMTTQLQNQDPFKPMENGDFLAQMAQFSTVSGIDRLESSFSGTADALMGNQTLQAAGLVDRDVLVPSSTGHFDGESPVSGVIELPGQTSQAALGVVDAGGQLVAQVPLSVGADGRARFSWDGVMANGTKAPPGNYRLEARYRVGGETVAAEPLVWGRVDSVSLQGPGGGIAINVTGMGPMSLSRAVEIS